MTMDRQQEFQAKLGMVRALFEPQQVDAILIEEQHAFAWITCGGDNHVSLGGVNGSAAVLITADKACLIVNNIEERRLREEEVGDLPFEVHTYNWFETNDRPVVKEIVGSGRLGSDLPRGDAKPVGGALVPLRYVLMEPEVERLKALGQQAESALRQACLETEPGESEYKIAAKLASACLARETLPMVMLVAVDERIDSIRHPIPTPKVLEKRAMLVLVCRKWGLNASCTRLIEFGAVDADIRHRHNAVTLIDATMIASTRVGSTLGEVITRAVEVYEQTGYPDQWHLHHQGGPTGYASRYMKPGKESTEVIQEQQAFAWNPSIDGVKSEDTILVTKDEIQVLTEARDWPKIEHQVDGLTIPRCDILVR